MELRNAISRLAELYDWPVPRAHPFQMLTAEGKREQDHRTGDSGAQIGFMGLRQSQAGLGDCQTAGEIPAVVLAVGAAFDFLQARPLCPGVGCAQIRDTEWFLSTGD